MDKNKAVGLVSLLGLCLALVAPSVHSAIQTSNGLWLWESGDTNYISTQNDNINFINGAIASTTTLAEVATSTTALSASTASLRTDVDANASQLTTVAVDTTAIAAINTSQDAIIAQVGVDTTAISAQLTQVAADTTTIEVDLLAAEADILALHVDTGTLQAADASHVALPDAHFTHATDLSSLNTQLGTSISDGAHTTNTNAATICTGSLVLEGSGACVANAGGGGVSNPMSTDLDGGDFQINNVSTLTVNGRILSGPSGGSASPVYSFSNEPNSGMYASANAMRLVNEGQESISIFAEGPNQTIHLRMQTWAEEDVDLRDNQLLGVSTITTNGQIRAWTGENSTPGFTFNGDEDTGLHSDSPNSIKISAGTQPIFDGSASQVGIPVPVVLQGTGASDGLQILSPNPITLSTFTFSYAGGSAHLCVDNSGVIFVSEAACP